MSDKDRPNLLAMLDAISQIESYTGQTSDADDFFKNRIVFDATLMNFVVLGEVSDRISDEAKSWRPNVLWKKIKGFRNLIAHEYLGIDAEAVWQIVQEEIPPLRDSIQQIIDTLPPS